eukprot:s85_g6.t2
MKSLKLVMMPCVLLLQCSMSDEDVFPVHLMLQAAVGQEADRVQASCVPAAAATRWREGFTAAVETMMQKTKRTMQLGLASLARGVLMLLDAESWLAYAGPNRAGRQYVRLTGRRQGFIALTFESSSCGDLVTFQQLKGQAKRLEVLASTRSLAGLDASVKYEPLKALTVGGVDVHLELNALLVAWQMNRGPKEVGSTLAKFLADFSEDDAVEAGEVPDVPEGPEAAVQHRPGSLQRKGQFWITMLNQALSKLSVAGDRPIVEACISDDLAGFHADRFDEAFGRMMQKTQRSMQAGLRLLATTVQALLATLEEGGQCPRLHSSQGVDRLRLSANRLETLVGTRSLINPGVKVKYEAMQMLTVGGLDVHLELNKLIGAWISDNRAEQVGDGLAEFFEDFNAKEETEQDTSNGQESMQEPELVRMMLDAVAAAGEGEVVNCFEIGQLEVFAHQVESSLEHMLKKRRKTMQQGLRELADAVSKLFTSLPVECRRARYAFAPVMPVSTTLYSGFVLLSAVRVSSRFPVKFG